MLWRWDGIMIEDCRGLELRITSWIYVYALVPKTQGNHASDGGGIFSESLAWLPPG